MTPEQPRPEHFGRDWQASAREIKMYRQMATNLRKRQDANNEHTEIGHPVAA
jgi:hypothetical protein